MKPIEFENCGHYSVSKEGVVMNTSTGKILKTDLTNMGYKRVALSARGKRIRISIHRLVALHYVDNPDDLPMVNHIDGNKLNNHCSNLEWVTCKQNTAHAFESGLRVGPNRLPEEVVRAVRKEQAAGIPRREICQKYGLSVSRYKDIRRYYKYI